MASPKHDLKIDWATFAAAKHACHHWHYSKCIPAGKLVKVGAWEKDKFLGVVLFGRGANHNMGKAFSVGQDQCVELVRIALREHDNPVSRISSLAIKFLKKANPGIRLVVSYADPDAGHHGGIYQAGNWLYTGESASAIKVWYKGRWAHKKTVDDAKVDQSRLKKKKVPGKHRYLMPLDAEMKASILHLAKPYPKRVTKANSGDQSESGGAVPTDTLQSNGEAVNA